MNRTENVRTVSALIGLLFAGGDYLKMILSHQTLDWAEVTTSALVGAVIGLVVGAGSEFIRATKNP